MKSFRLRTHLIFYFSAVTFLLTAALISIYTARYKEYAVASLSEYGKAITQNTAFSAADYIIAEDYAPLQEFVQEFSSRRNVLAIEISDANYSVLAASDLNRLGGIMEKQLDDKCTHTEKDICIRTDKDGRQLIITAPILVQGISIGNSRLYLDMSDILGHIADVQKKGAATGLLFWLISILCGMISAKKLTQAMHNFMQATDAISRGSFDITIPTSKWVLELDRFGKALGVMSRAIASREQALRNSEKKYRLLFERAHEGIFVCGADGTFVEVNPALLSILGYSDRERLLATNLFTEIFVEEDAVVIFKQQLERQHFVKGFEVNFTRKDGNAIIVSLSCHVLQDESGRIKKYEGMLRDVTEEKQAAREIAKMRNYLNNIIESMPSMLVTIDSNCMVTQWNSAAFQLTGVASNEAIGKKIWDIAPFFSKYMEQVKEITASRQPIKMQHEQMFEEEEHIFNLTMFPLVANGTSGIAIRLDDITELEVKERQLRQAQKMESIGTLAGGLAHDFNNVLGGILGNLSLIQFKIDNKREIDQAQMQEYLNRMTTAGERAVDLVKQLLTLSRKQDIDLVPVDLNLSIKHVRKIGENTFDKSVNIITEPALESAYTMADPTQVEQVLLNLCINAVHAMTIMRTDDPWGGTLSVGLKKISADGIFKKSHPEAKAEAYWLLSVSDTGIGMDTKTVSKIFDPFFTTKEKGKGTGLGLAMVYNIIKQQNGFIEVNTEQGIGSTFNVYFPLLDRQALASPDKAASVMEGGEGLILVVDDDRIMRETACDILRTAGYQVLTAGNGAEAVAVYRDHRNDIRAILLDMIMPIMSGKEAYIQLKKINPGVKVLMASGFRQDERVDEVLALGINKFLQKPYTLENLTKAMAAVLNG